MRSSVIFRHPHVITRDRQEKVRAVADQERERESERARVIKARITHVREISARKTDGSDLFRHAGYFRRLKERERKREEGKRTALAWREKERSRDRARVSPPLASVEHASRKRSRARALLVVANRSLSLEQRPQKSVRDLQDKGQNTEIADGRACDLSICVCVCVRA